MICDNVDHEIHAAGMYGIRQRPQVCRRTEVWVYGVDILRPVAVIRLTIGTVSGEILDDG